MWLHRSQYHSAISQYLQDSLVAQLVKNPSAVQETWVWSLGWEDPLERERLPIPVFWIPWTSPWGCRVGHDSETLTHRIKSDAFVDTPCPSPGALWLLSSCHIATTPSVHGVCIRSCSPTAAPEMCDSYSDSVLGCWPTPKLPSPPGGISLFNWLVFFFMRFSHSLWKKRCAVFMSPLLQPPWGRSLFLFESLVLGK